MFEIGEHVASVAFVDEALGEDLREDLDPDFGGNDDPGYAEDLLRDEIDYLGMVLDVVRLAVPCGVCRLLFVGHLYQTPSFALFRGDDLVPGRQCTALYAWDLFEPVLGRTYDIRDHCINEGLPIVRETQGIETPYILEGAKFTIPMVLVVLTTILSMNGLCGSVHQ